MTAVAAGPWPAFDPALCDPDLPVIGQFRGEHAFLSNFHPAVHHLDRLTYPSTEHSFNAGKTADPAVRAWIAQAPTARLAKARGNDRTRVLLIPGWDTGGSQARMAACLSAKFRAHPARVAALLSTGRRPLAEGNLHHDNRWGHCFCGRPACAVLGWNWLGVALMELRAELAREQ